MKIDFNPFEIESLIIAITSRIETLTAIRDALPADSRRRSVLTQIIRSDVSLQARLYAELSKINHNF